MPPISASATAGTPPAATSTAPKPHHGFFHDLLSELNPLQYIPVVGTIYRSVTGDTIPETARLAGSLVVSFLTGGPIGAAINLGSVAAEKATGIDPEKLGQRILADLGIGAKRTPAAAKSNQPAAKPQALVSVAETRLQSHPGWSRAQLAAYGVTTTEAGDLKRGALQGSDVLNDLELIRQKAATIA